MALELCGQGTENARHALRCSIMDLCSVLQVSFFDKTEIILSSEERIVSYTDQSGVVWCGVVWCGVVWCGVVWCGVVWCGVVCRRRCSQMAMARMPCIRVMQNGGAVCLNMRCV